MYNREAETVSQCFRRENIMSLLISAYLRENIVPRYC